MHRTTTATERATLRCRRGRQDERGRECQIPFSALQQEGAGKAEIPSVFPSGERRESAQSYAGKVAANLRSRPAAMGVFGIDVEVGSTSEEVIESLGLNDWEALKTAQYIEIPGRLGRWLMVPQYQPSKGWIRAGIPRSTVRPYNHSGTSVRTTNSSSP